MSITLNTLGKKLGLSRQYLSRAESGTYSSLNPQLAKWVANSLDWEVQSVHERYETFQDARRRATMDEVQPHKLERHESHEPGHVLFERWRSGYWVSPVAFANAFCVHPDLVQKYEEGVQKRMPRQIREVLRGFGIIDSNWVDAPESV